MRNRYIVLILLMFSIPSLCWAERDHKINDSEFYEPNIKNSYQGRLLYDPLTQDYPIDKMIKLCEPYTGIDTAQIKCEELNDQKMKVCKYKCSMHWLTGKD